MNNIIFTSFNPKDCASFIEPNRIPSTLVEVTGILNDALFYTKFPDSFNLCFLDSKLKKPTSDRSDPFVLWAMESFSHYDWLMNYWCALQDIHFETFKFYHDSYQMIEILTESEDLLKTGSFYAPPNLALDPALGVDFTDMEDSTLAYKLLVHAQSRLRCPIVSDTDFNK